MPRRLSVTVDRFPLAQEFRISRGAKTEAVVVVCRIDEGDKSGFGECVPYPRYGESIEGVGADIMQNRTDIEAGIDRQQLLSLMKPGAARNAVDCALWDLEAKLSGDAVFRSLNLESPRALQTAYTISLGDASAMAEAARAANRALLKIKVGTEHDLERIDAIHRAAPHARLILDANEGWTEESLAENMLAAAASGAVLIEQPLPSGADALLSRIPHPVPICADESVHTADDLEALRGRYDYVNIKLDKTGGLTEALRLMQQAHSMGFGVMVGCMVGSSLSMAPAVLLAQRAEFVDLDGPLLLAKDRTNALVYDATTVAPPLPSLWG